METDYKTGCDILCKGSNESIFGRRNRLSMLLKKMGALKNSLGGGTLFIIGQSFSLKIVVLK